MFKINDNNKKDLFVLDEKVYVNSEYLKSYGIPVQTIKNGTCNFNKARSKHWNNIKLSRDNRVVLIELRSIPKRTRANYSLLSDEEINYYEENIYSLVEGYKKKEEANKDKANDLIIEVSFKRAYDNDYRKYQGAYINKYGKYLDVTSYARMHAFFKVIIELKKSGYSIKKLYEYYTQYSDLPFQTYLLSSFYRKLREVKRRFSQGQLLANSSLGSFREKYKITDFYYAKIRELYRISNKISYDDILIELNKSAIENEYEPISLSTLKRILRDPEMKNYCLAYRYGEQEAKNSLYPFVVRATANVGDVWELDGSKFQFPYKNEDGNLDFLDLFVVYDTYSRKIVGYSLSENENIDMILSALEMACLSTNYLPNELTYDHASSYKTEKFKNFKDSIESLKVTARQCRSGNPQDKGGVERWFGTFQTSICKSVHGYIGEGIRSKRKNAHPSPEQLERYRKNLRSKEELLLLAKGLIEKYNNKAINGLSPNQKFKKGKPANAKSLTRGQIVQLFWNKTKLKVQNSMVILTVDKIKHYYTLLKKPELCIKLNGQQVEVAFKKDQLDKIILFNMHTSKLITIVKRDPIIMRNEDFSKNEHVKQVNSLRRDIKKACKARKLKDQKSIENEISKNIPLNLLIPSKDSKNTIRQAERAFLLNVVSKNENETPKEQSTDKEKIERIINSKFNRKKSS